MGEREYCTILRDDYCETSRPFIIILSFRMKSSHYFSNFQLLINL